MCSRNGYEHTFYYWKYLPFALMVRYQVMTCQGDWTKSFLSARNGKQEAMIGSGDKYEV